MTTTIQLEALFIREINRCYARIGECETKEAALGPGFDPKARAAIDRDRDRAFIALRRAMKALKELQAETQPSTKTEPADKAHSKPAQVIEFPKQTPIARNAQCPCGSGEKYKRCCGRNAPPLPGDFRKPTPLAA